MKLDNIDRRILQQLQVNANLPLTEIALIAGLSDTACWRRIKKLEEMGVIGPRVALLSQDKLDLKLTGFVTIKTANHTEEWTRAFIDRIVALPWVMEFYRMTGDVDYLLKIVAPDLHAYNQLYSAITRMPDLKDVSASFAMERIKSTTQLPVLLDVDSDAGGSWPDNPD